MARQRRTSRVLETARQRLAGLKSINPEPDLGTVLSPDPFEAKVTAFDTRIASYNGKIAALDEESNELDTDEKGLNDLNRRVLSAVEAKYGADSNEYEMVGGTRTSERKRSARKAAGGTPPPAP